MKRASLAFGAIASAFLLSSALERDAKACGGCFHPVVTQSTGDINDERMLLAVSPTQTTLYDQIHYTGSPTSFAWVLPIHGTVDVGLSADVLFDSVDLFTETVVTTPTPNCPPVPRCGSSAGVAGGIDGGDMGGVMVTKQENVGPYATVQLHATDSSALANWLSTNGFAIPAAEQPIIDQYVVEGFDFLAMKLLPNQGVQAMRPVRVTSQGASLSLPLRMARIGTGTTVGITLWVVSDGRYEPQNFPFFHIDDSELIWNFATSSSNYAQLRAQHEAALGNKAWEIESSITVGQLMLTDTIEAGGRYGLGAQFAPASDDYLATPPSDLGDGGDDGGSSEGGAGQTAEAVRQADIAALFGGLGQNVRITRMRSDMAHSAMTTDLVLTASADQSEVSNFRSATKQINLVCPTAPTCGGGPPVLDAGKRATDGGTAGAADSATTTNDQGGCATTGSSGNDSLLVTIGVGLGLLALVAVRAPRRRSKEK
jgi:hypothetical protein